MHKPKSQWVLRRLLVLAMFSLVCSLIFPVLSATGQEATNTEMATPVAPQGDGSMPADAPADASDPGSTIPELTDTTSVLGETGDSSLPEDAPADATDTPPDAATPDPALAAPEVLLVVQTEGDSDVEVVSLTVEEAPPAAAMEALALTPGNLAPQIDTPDNVVAVLVGSGITYSNIQYTGSPSALGKFEGGDGIIGFPSGMIIGTGNIMTVVGPNDDSGAGTNLGEPGDSTLTDLAQQQTYDASILSFDFVPTGNTVEFKYVFSSEEYNEYVGQFNDVFAFYVNDTNCATVAGKPVSVNTINNNSNSSLYVDNEDGHLNTEMDGLTVVLSCVAPVTPGQPNFMKFMIADSGDGVLDSHVFIQAKSFVIVTPTPEVSPTPGASPSPEVSPTPGASPSPEVSPTPENTPAPVGGGVVTSLPATGSGSASSSGGTTGLAILVLGAMTIAFASHRLYARR